MKRELFNLIAVICVVFLFVACNKDLPLEDQEAGQEIEIPANMDDETFVSLQQANDVAEAFFGGLSTLKSAGTQKRIVSTETITDRENQNPSMYVMNYSDGGFVIVSSTRNYYPILAYSDENSFELAENMGPVTVWLEETKQAIRESEDLDKETKREIYSLWKSYETEEFQIPPSSALKSFNPLEDAFGTRLGQLYSQYRTDGWIYFQSLQAAYYNLDSSDWSNLCSLANSFGSPIEYTIVVSKPDNVSNIVGPLLPTKWHQGNPYNELCTPCIAGCSTIAMAQIMRHHQYPTYFNWSDIPVSNATINTQLLILNIGYALGLDYINCNLGATNNQVKNAFQSFGYTTTLKEHNATDVRNSIIAQRPVYMGGYTNQILGIPCGDGHHWACDGVNESIMRSAYFVEFINPYSCTYSTQGYTSPSNPGISMTSGSLSFYMNWGWGNSCDGWFAYNSVNSGNGNFQYGRKNFYIKCGNPNCLICNP